MCFQKFFELVSGFSGFNERRDVVPFCGCSHCDFIVAFRFSRHFTNNFQKIGRMTGLFSLKIITNDAVLLKSDL